MCRFRHVDATLATLKTRGRRSVEDRLPVNVSRNDDRRALLGTTSCGVAARRDRRISVLCVSLVLRTKRAREVGHRKVDLLLWLKPGTLIRNGHFDLVVV